MNRLNLKTSDSFYNKLDKWFIEHGDKEKCNDLDRELKQHHGVYEFCFSLIGNLKKFDELPSLNLFDKYRCRYFNIWVYEKLKKLFPDIKDPKCTTMQTKIMSFWDSYKKDKKCNWDFPSYIINNDQYDKMKDLYDYALNYEMLKLDIENYNYPCTHEISNYIEKSIQLYNEMKEECGVTEEHKKYCVALNEIKDIYGNEQLTKLKCTKVLSSEEANTEIETMLKRQVDGVEFREVTTHDSMQVTDEHSRDTDLVSQQVTTSFSDSTNHMTVALPLVGTLLTFFVLYKFTPIAPRLHSLLMKRKIIEEEMNENSPHELLENIFDPLETNAPRDDHSVGYHPVLNA
ncbi:PIR Superfamily Protein [Plasmodium ovale wallikeri]|uniref:PIR Superfamily Protein n=2 Tax=Plasmodium ovale TaxID=36330 RepID=A0A1A9AJF8_PLAOA|nr:PIR Superfamily Protein [Plasmodium ovale wallikeri]SBT56298.1 PIR Superfamily Protein [Plasmodium ovale wallikeri]SBT74134.1 PIR protein [Plasmodium ovale]